MKQSYKDSGVDVDAGDRLVSWLQADQRQQPWQSRILDGMGGFAALFRGDFPEMKKPVLVACTDGVGTKVLLASEYQRMQGVGQDLVGMCVNDLICTGGMPLFFLDYYAVGKLDETQAQAFLTSVREACSEAECALIGGETAEMPGVYQVGHFDCAGFAVGVVDEDRRLGAHRVRPGDVAIGVSSNGFHSNGYSLLRKIFAADVGPWLDTLLKPTALYVKLAKALGQESLVHALAHITGGGMENLPRVLPAGVHLKLRRWQWPEAFVEVHKRTGMSEIEMLQTLNCGVGLCVFTSPVNSQRVHELIAAHGYTAIDLGEVLPASESSEASPTFGAEVSHPEAFVDYSAWAE